MKPLLTFLLIVFTHASTGQERVGFGEIDWKVLSIDAPTPDSLSKLLTAPYETDVQKVRSIFSWIAHHISYNTFVYSAARRFASGRYIPEPEDTATTWKSAIEMTAMKVMRKRTAVCDGYSKLFKTLCDYAGIPCEVITGYARGYSGGDNSFRANHSWNAVMIDSAWKLLDVTWASGYVNYADQFVQRLDDSYFLTAPERFAQDHFPEDISWTLLDRPPFLREFQRMPFRAKSFVKYMVTSYAPSKGVLETFVGDTLKLEITIKDALRNRKISPDPFFDSSSIDQSLTSVFLSSSDTSGNNFIFRYTVKDPAIEWVNLVYNQDVILRYRLRIRNADGMLAKKLD